MYLNKEKPIKKLHEKTSKRIFVHFSSKTQRCFIPLYYFRVKRNAFTFELCTQNDFQMKRKTTYKEESMHYKQREEIIRVENTEGGFPFFRRFIGKSGKTYGLFRFFFFD